MIEITKEFLEQAFHLISQSRTFLQTENVNDFIMKFSQAIPQILDLQQNNKNHIEIISRLDKKIGELQHANSTLEDNYKWSISEQAQQGIKIKKIKEELENYIKKLNSNLIDYNNMIDLEPFQKLLELVNC